MCRLSESVLYLLNTVLFVISAVLLVGPFVGSKEFCDIKPSQLASLDFFPVISALGGFLLIFSICGCCLAKTGQKRYRIPYITISLLGLVCVGAMLAMLFDGAFVLDKLQTFNPDAPGDLQKEIQGLKSAGMDHLYNDFGLLYEEGQCSKVSEFACKTCPPMESALQGCSKNWPHTPAADAYLADCKAQFSKKLADAAKCDANCVEIFCECTGEMQDMLKDGADYVKISLIGLFGILFVLLLTACMTHRHEQHEARVLLLQQPQHPQQPGGPLPATYVVNQQGQPVAQPIYA